MTFKRECVIERSRSSFNDNLAHAVDSRAVDDIPPNLSPLFMEWALEVFHLELVLTGNTNSAWLHLIIEHPVADAELKSRANEYLQLLANHVDIGTADKANTDLEIENMLVATRDVLAKLNAGVAS